MFQGVPKCWHSPLADVDVGRAVLFRPMGEHFIANATATLLPLRDVQRGGAAARPRE